MQEWEISTTAASRRRKWLFWIILGALSTFFAEVTAGSTPLPFFNPLGLLLGWVRRRGKILLVLLLIWGGLFTSVNSPSVVRSVLSTFGSGAVVLVLMFVWKRTGGASYRMRDLLPGRKGRVAVAVFMGLMYVAAAIIGELLRIEIPLIIVSFVSIVFPGAFLLCVSIRDANPNSPYSKNEGNRT